MARFIRHHNNSNEIYNMDCIVSIRQSAKWELMIDFLPSSTIIESIFYTVENFETEKEMTDRLNYLLSYGTYK